jgi:hypothetical protein
MRVRLKGINSIRKRLADGSYRTYCYAWKGGPPLHGEPGTPEFAASYHAAVSAKRPPPDGKLVSLLMRFRESEFPRLAPETQRGYGKTLLLIEREFRDFPIVALTDRRSRAVFMEWRDKIAVRSRRQADYCWTVLARVLSWALDRGLAAANPCTRGGRANRIDKVWTEQDEATFLARAPAHLHLPLMLALWTGQRQGDLLRLPVVRLRWHPYPAATVQDWTARYRPCWGAAEGAARCDA